MDLTFCEKNFSYVLLAPFAFVVELMVELNAYFDMRMVY